VEAKVMEDDVTL